MPAHLLFFRSLAARPPHREPSAARSSGFWHGPEVLCDFGPDGVYDKLVTTGLPKDLTSKDIPALQAADFWAWENRKNHLHMDEWWSLKDRPQAWGDERWEHMSRWVEEKYGSFEEITRKSLQELLRRSNFKCLIFDYQGLRETHQARGGVWS
jgi:hypothetical protein